MTEDDVGLVLQNLTNNQNLSELLFHPGDEKSVFEQVTKICFYTITIVVGFCANGLIVVVISGTNSLRTKCNFYVVNLAVADIFVLMFCSWIHLVSDLKQQWILGSFMCTANAFVQVTVESASILTLTVTVVDRYFASKHPRLLQYTQTCQSGVILAIWTAAVLVAIPWALYVKQVKFHWATGLGIACEDLFPSQEFKKVYTTLFAVVIYMIPLCAMFALLFAILNTPKKTSRVNEHSYPWTEAANEHQVSMTTTSDQVHDRRISEHSFPGTEAANEHQVSITRISDQVHDRRVSEHSFPGTEAANEYQVSMARTSDQVHDRRISEHSFPGTEAANEHQVSITRISDQVHDRRVSEHSFPGTETANEHQVSITRISDQVHDRRISLNMELPHAQNMRQNVSRHVLQIADISQITKQLVLLMKVMAVNMTLTLLVVFFICWTPQQTTLLWDIYRDRRKEKPNGIVAFKYIALYMAYSSSAVNPVVYMMFNKCFQIAAWKSLRFWKKGENSVLTVCPSTQSDTPS